MAPMYWRDVVTLKAGTEGRDADGFPKETITETTVFADVSSTKRSEFYAARQSGYLARADGKAPRR